MGRHPIQRPAVPALRPNRGPSGRRGGLACGRQALAADGKLTLAFIPQENPEKLLGDIEIISAYISKLIGVPVSGFVTSDHAAAVEALRQIVERLR